MQGGCYTVHSPQFSGQAAEPRAFHHGVRDHAELCTVDCLRRRTVAPVESRRGRANFEANLLIRNEMQKKGRPRQTGCLDPHSFLENGHCRVCARARSRDFRRVHRSKVQAADRARKARLRASGEESALLARARAIVGVYVRRGKLARPATCAECVSPKPLPFHADAGRPLDVEWLCKSCRRYRAVLQEADLVAQRVAVAEEERAKELAGRNRLRARGEELYRGLPEHARALLDRRFGLVGHRAVEDLTLDDAGRAAVVEFLDRRASHERTRALFRRLTEGK